ncbi:g256 [Coccomyxa viridis]|uniref:G256 protein n=1 Tax=Coccomyxa viridis TaxID=1274662 RepID=A0ABP1FIZ1_9CHLO
MHLPQQAAASARPAEDSGSSQKQEGSAGSPRFTPAQQAVAAALMVVIKRAMENGKEAAMAAKMTLADKNPTTSLFLAMLLENGPLPTLKQIEQRASDELLESLTKLASQCAAAQCQPLEVFPRSMQCRARTPIANCIAVERDVYERQEEDEQQHVPPAAPLRRI